MAARPPTLSSRGRRGRLAPVPLLHVRCAPIAVAIAIGEKAVLRYSIVPPDLAARDVSLFGVAAGICHPDEIILIPIKYSARASGMVVARPVGVVSERE